MRVESIYSWTVTATAQPSCLMFDGREVLLLLCAVFDKFAIERWCEQSHYRVNSPSQHITTNSGVFIGGGGGLWPRLAKVFCSYLSVVPLHIAR